MKHLFAVLAFILIQLNVNAQEYTISGTVKNAAGEALSSATVFIAGSEQITMTNDGGAFIFKKIGSGTYQVVVNMVGYVSVKQNVIINDKAENVNLILSEKQTMLNEVVVGGKKTNDESHLKTFIKYFMGESANAKACKILNPEIIEFSTSKGKLKAATYDFLEVENNNLGYRIKYLLKNFEYDKDKQITSYDGDCIFENMDGTPEQQTKWTVNRKKVYEGSLMHFLRAFYAGDSRKEGFLIYMPRSDFHPFSIDPNPVVPEQLIKHVDNNFVSFRFPKRLYIVYDKKKAAKEDKPATESIIISDMTDDNASLFLVDSQIDRRGSFAKYNKLLIQGGWGRKRIGDQLPLEYQ